MIKKYEYFLNESEKFDYHYQNRAELYVAQLCEEKLREEFNKFKNQEQPEEDPYGEELWENEIDWHDLHPVIINILDEFYQQWNWREAAIEEMEQNVIHFVHYYILDDGDVSYDPEKDRLVRTEHRQERGWDDNLSQEGAAMWILEKLGVIIPCVVILSKRNEEVLAKCESWGEAVKEFHKIIKEKNIDEWNCRYDMCSVTGKFSIYIMPVVPV